MSSSLGQPLAASPVPVGLGPGSSRCFLRFPFAPGKNPMLFSPLSRKLVFWMVRPKVIGRGHRRTMFACIVLIEFDEQCPRYLAMDGCFRYPED